MTFAYGQEQKADKKTALNDPAILKEVDQLIQQKNINGALVLIQQYMKDYPNDFDNAQKRVKKIMKTRKNYANMAENLFHVLANDPENNKKQLQIIADLEGMEKNPSPATQKFIKTAKSAAQFTYYRALYNKIMDEGSKQKLKAEYVKSINTFYSGMYLYQDEFFESNYETGITQRIQLEINDLQRLVITGNSQLEDLRAKYNSLSQSLKEKNFSKTNNDYKAFQAAFEKFAETRNAIARIGWDFTSTYAELRKIDPELTDASFLPFAFRLILGDEKIENSGILASMDYQWEEMIPALLPLADRQILGLLNDAINSINTENLFTNKDFKIPQTNFSSAGQYIQLTKKINSIYELKEVSLKKYDMSHSKEGNARTASPESFISLTESQENNLTRLINLNKDIDTRKKPSASDIKANNAYINFMLESTQLYSEIVTEDTDLQEKAKIAKKAAYEQPFSTYDIICEKIYDECNSKMTNVWVALAKHYDTEALAISDKYKKAVEKAEKLLNREKKADENGLVSSKPADTLPVLEEQFAKYKQDIENLNKCLERLQSLPEQITKSDTKEILDSVKNIQTAIESITQLQSENQELSRYAKEQIQLAQRAQNEAELRLNQSRKNLRQNEFDQARDNLQKARNKFNEALSYSDSDKLRNKTDVQIENLATEINKKHNEVIVSEVRDLKNQAKQAYKDGNYELADSLLAKAQNQWAITNIDPDEEIVDMYSLINTALAIKTGRTIPPTNPLYPEMSNLLSIANQYYNQGAGLLKENKREEALHVLNEAENKLAEVRVSFPLNQDSRLLSLKIKKLIDPENFEIQFKSDVESAIEKYRTNKEKRNEAYIDLVDLAQISPDYPGLKKRIENIEIDLGMRLPPPDPQAIARSRSLTREATTLYNTSRDEISMNTALAKINEAIRLNADNDEAKLLKDKIQTRVGGKASVVLSAESERIYQMAIQELQKGNIIQASALVSQLMQKKENQRSAKILDLKKKVESFL
ncbi:MAG: hypothetical protein K5839_04715 [Treponemataceae bacterium]|nr:hypothetical protein [Treponemataceae bacterium]